VRLPRSSGKVHTAHDASGHDGGIVSSIYVSQDARGRLIFRVEERSKEKRRRGCIEELFDISHKRRKVRMWIQSLPSKRSLETSHDQGRTNSLC
jgi:hypothetical protein